MQANTDLKGLRVAISGGTSGLGLAMVRALSARGARVAFFARSAAAVARVALETGAHGIVGDIGNKDDIYPLALQITGQLGGLDVLVNNASTLGPRPLRPLADTDCEDLEHALAVNLVGPFRLTKALFGALASSVRRNGTAVVVNVSSDAAVSAYPTWGAYGASKAGLKHLTAIWQEEAGEAGQAGEACIQFLSIDPGDMNTPMHLAAIPGADLGTLKRPEDSASEIIDVIATKLAQRHAPGHAQGNATDHPAAAQTVQS